MTERLGIARTELVNDRDFSSCPSSCDEGKITVAGCASKATAIEELIGEF